MEQAHWRNGPARALDLFDLKGALESLGMGELKLERSADSDFALGAKVFAGERQLGMAGQLVSTHFGKVAATGPIFVAEIDLPNELEIALGPSKFRELQRFPSVTRDIAMLAPEKLTHHEILAVIHGADEPLLAAAALFDLFTGPAAAQLGPGQKSLAYALTYRNKNRTLTHDEVNTAHDRIRERLKSELGVELRE